METLPRDLIIYLSEFLKIGDYIRFMCVSNRYWKSLNPKCIERKLLACGNFDVMSTAIEMKDLNLVKYAYEHNLYIDTSMDTLNLVNGLVGARVQALTRSTYIPETLTSGNMEVFKFLMDKFEYGEAPLFHACTGGNIELVKLLMRMGHRRSDGCMVKCIQSNRLEILKLIHNLPGAWNCNDVPVYTNESVKHGNLEICKFLIGLNLFNPRFICDFHTLLKIIEHKDLYFIQWLYDHGLNIDLIYKAAISADAIECYEYLSNLHPIPVNTHLHSILKRNATKILILVSKTNNTYLCKHLIRNNNLGLFREIYNPKEPQSLALAAEYSLEILAFMIESGHTKSVHNLLNIAVKAKQPEIVSYLHSKGYTGTKQTLLYALNTKNTTIIELVHTFGYTSEIDIFDYTLSLHNLKVLQFLHKVGYRGSTYCIDIVATTYENSFFKYVDFLVQSGYKFTKKILLRGISRLNMDYKKFIKAGILQLSDFIQFGLKYRREQMLLSLAYLGYNLGKDINYRALEYDLGGLANWTKIHQIENGRKLLKEFYITGNLQGIELMENFGYQITVPKKIHKNSKQWLLIHGREAELYL